MMAAEPACRLPFPTPPARAAGIGMVWVILCITFAFIGVIMGIWFWTDWKDSEATLKTLQAEEERLKGLHEKEKQAVLSVLPYTGFKKMEETDDPPTADALKYLQDRQAEYRHEPALKGEKIEKQRALATLQDCLEFADKILDAAVKDRDRAEAELKRRQAAVEAVKPRKPETEAVRDKSSAELNRDITAAGEEVTRMNADFEQARQALEEEARKCNEEREAAIKKHKDEMIRLENEINELKRRLEEVKRREVITFDITEIHGEIMQHDIEGRYAFINIGSDQRVVKGLRFYVAIPGDFGKKRYKGEVEVKRVWPTRSQVSVIAVYDPEHPIVPGDQLVNPLFDTRRPKIVAFAGEPSFRQMKYPVNEAMRRILEIHSVVKDQTTVDLDFLMTTEAYEGDKNFLKAVELQIPVASATDILKFLGD